MGVGYAAWTDTLSINGAVQTATFNVEWVSSPVNSNSTGTTCTATIGAGLATGDDSSGYDENIAVSFTNVYPGASCDVTGTAQNFSSIPVNQSSLLVVSNDPQLAVSVTSCGFVGNTLAANTGTMSCQFVITAGTRSCPQRTTRCQPPCSSRVRRSEAASIRPI